MSAQALSLLVVLVLVAVFFCEVVVWQANESVPRAGTELQERG